VSDTATIPELLTASEVAAKFSVSPKSVRRWATEGGLPHYRLFGTLRFAEAEVAEWLGRQHREGVGEE